MYGQAIFTIQRDRPVLTVPTAALLFEADGKQVAVVTPDNQVHFQKIALGNDYGTEIEVISGLQGDERVIANPGEQLAEGVEVSPVAEENDGAPAGNGAQSASTKPDRQ
jgi:hypothetical protein